MRDQDTNRHWASCHTANKKTAIPMKLSPLRTVPHGESSGRSSRAEQAYSRIRLEILTFGLLPGEMVSEVALTERFELSLGAVRAVLPYLRQDGLLINKKRRGQMVCPVTLDDIDNTYELRCLLEPVAAEKAVTRLNAETLRDLDEEVSAHILAGDRESLVEAIFAHRDFHVAIAAACGIPQLARWISDLHDKVVRFQYLNLQNAEAQGVSWPDNHKDIINAFEDSDPQRAAEAMQEDVSGGSESMLQVILSRPEFREMNIAGSELREATV